MSAVTALMLPMLCGCVLPTHSPSEEAHYSLADYDPFGPIGRLTASHEALAGYLNCCDAAQTAARLGVPVVSASWVEACDKQHAVVRP